jgi:8-oxo-dGTP pyrophosphatase MutT (NUDIX family)
MRDGDESPLATALRECQEEIGVAPEPGLVLGELPPRESSTGIHVHCVVARLPVAELVPDPREVVRVLRVPLAELQDDVRWQELPPPFGSSGRQPRTSPHFRFGDELLWGLTARFVRDLLRALAAR